PADAGGNNVYDVQVTANDGNGGVDTQDIAVTVTNQNEVPVITTNGGGANAAVNASENQTAVTTVAASDVDGDVPTYSITGGADAAFFAIDPNTAVLTFVAAPDFETPADAGGNNVYDVQVTANDGNGGIDTQDIAVTVTNQNVAAAAAAPDPAQSAAASVSNPAGDPQVASPSGVAPSVGDDPPAPVSDETVAGQIFEADGDDDFLRTEKRSVESDEEELDSDMLPLMRSLSGAAYQGQIANLTNASSDAVDEVRSAAEFDEDDFVEGGGKENSLASILAKNRSKLLDPQSQLQLGTGLKPSQPEPEKVDRDGVHHHFEMLQDSEDRAAFFKGIDESLREHSQSEIGLSISDIGVPVAVSVGSVVGGAALALRMATAAGTLAAATRPIAGIEPQILIKSSEPDPDYHQLTDAEQLFGEQEPSQTNVSEGVK
ncbi:MAG: hypothetical protein AAF468_14030, partial [Pseudomonadota bacterium]